MTDVPRATKVHHVTLIVVDHNQLGAAGVVRTIEDARYPNHCFSPQILSTVTREVDWTDEHPLNDDRTLRPAVAELFPDVRDQFQTAEQVAQVRDALVEVAYKIRTADWIPK